MIAAQPTPAAPATHFEVRLRSARGAPEALVVFPADAQVAEVVFATAAGPVRAKLSKLTSGATLLDLVALPAAGVEVGFDAAGQLPTAVQVFDQSYTFPEMGRALQRARPPNATSSQDGDLTVVHRTVSLDPTADRGTLRTSLSRSSNGWHAVPPTADCRFAVWLGRPPHLGIAGTVSPRQDPESAPRGRPAWRRT